MFRKSKRSTLLRPLGQAQSHGVGNIRNEAAILLVEDVFLLTRQEKICERLADLIGDIGEIERLFVAVGACDRYSSEWMGRCGKSFAPGEVGLLVARHGDEALQRDIFVE